jgi:hypothetical protein
MMNAMSFANVSKQISALGLTAALSGVLWIHGTAFAATKKAAPVKSASTCTIKGNINKKERIYHLPGCASYKATKIDASKGERMFCSEKEAVTAGWRKAKNCPK